MNTNRVSINLVALQHNLEVIGRWMSLHGGSWTVVTKALCGHEDSLRALDTLGVRSIADSRLENIEVVERVAPKIEKWYLRLPELSNVADVVRLADVSLNSESVVIRALSEEARRQGKIHRIIIMIELGDLREGILPGTLLDFYRKVFDLPHIEVIGIGGQLGCLAGAVPSIDQFTQLAMYRELLELKFGRKLPIISAGSSVSLSLLLDGSLPRGINHFRIGEALFLGTDLVHGGVLDGLRDDVIFLETEIAEITEKALVPLGETGASTPFETLASEGDSPAPGERGFRAVVTVGQLDTDVAGLTPVDPNHHIAGSSSDLTVVNLGKTPGSLQVGDTLRFHVNYSAFVRLMSSRYIAREVHPPLSAFNEAIPNDFDVEVRPAVVPHPEREAE